MKASKKQQKIQNQKPIKQTRQKTPNQTKNPESSPQFIPEILYWGPLSAISHTQALFPTFLPLY